MRIVRGPDGSVTWDRTGRAPGRGAYVCSDEACFEQAVRRGRLGRALRAEIGTGELEHLKRSGV